MPVHRSRRPAFTLIELLVVIAIIAILAALTALFFPNFNDKELVNRGADQLQNWLLSAKMQAKRDGRPTGIQISNGSGTSTSQVVYIQQPSDFALGVYTGADPDPNPSAGTTGFPRAKFFLPPASPAPQVRFYDGSAGYVVRAGDYLEVYGGGVLHRIKRVPQPSTDAGFFPPSASENSSLILESTTFPVAATTPPFPNVSTSPLPPPNYRIIPQPQPLSGEQPLALPNNVAVSFETPTGSTLSQNVPPNGQILFSPSGVVVGEGTGTGQIILWVRDVSKPISSSDLLAGRGTLIVIQPRTGFIAAHPVAPGGDPYLFMRDGRSSGF